MTPSGIKFNTKDQPEFFKHLRDNVNAHFQRHNRSKHANFNMVLKTIFMLSLYSTPLVLMLTGVVQSTLGTLGMWTLMGLGMAGIGLSIMHDANHGAYSSSPFWNKVLGFTLNIIGGYHVNWKIQHNVLHHSYTNIDGHDDDISKAGIFRLSPHQEYRSHFRYQVYYASFFYALMSIYWLLAKDIDQVFKYHKKGLYKSQGVSFRSALTQIIIHKSWYLAITLLLPIILIPLPWWQILLGFLLMHGICGLLLAFIFQSAHIIEDTHFFAPDKNGSVINNWAIHQMMTTANFANKSVIFSWFIGGLNYQIEHHLFPNICHIHYRDIAPIVKATAEQFNIPYYQHKTFFGAVRSHFLHLDQLGRKA